MESADYFLSLRPAWPWSTYPFGLPALALVTILLVGLTFATYRRNTTTSRGRILIVLALRLLALMIALLTALRPSLGIQEDPNVPSTLLIGIDLSESMTIRDEFNNQTRIEAVRKVLEKSEPILETLKKEQGINVVVYEFGNSDFNEADGIYDASAPARFKRSDYGVYLQRTFEKWQSERFVRAHLVIGDGADNGTLSGEAEAARWRGTTSIQTFLTGRTTTRPDGKDVAVVGVSADPSPVPIKNDVALKIMLNAFGFPNGRVPVKVLFDGQQVAQETAILAKEIGNELIVTVKAPDSPGEIRVRVEVPIESTPGDANPTNNVLDTFLTVTKEGVRLLLVDRDRFEHTFLRDVLRSEKRFDITDVVRQRDDPPSPEERAAFDFKSRRYDAIVLGNVSAKQLQAIDPLLPRLIREEVLTKGTGLIMLGGDASFAGTLERPYDTGWRGTDLESILPVSLERFPNLPEALFRGEDRRFQTVPTNAGLQYLMAVGSTRENSIALWDRLNALERGQPPTRMTAIARMGDPKAGAVVYATASDDRAVVPAGTRANDVKPPWLLVGWETEGSGKGRVLAFAGYDTYLWRAMGRRATPPNRDGFELHAQFWRRVMLWLAKQDEAEGAAYAKPEYRRLPVRGRQSVAVGLRTPEGVELATASLEVKIALPGQPPEQATLLPVITDAYGQRRVVYEPRLPGEYLVLVKATGKDATGKDVQGEANARFVAFPEASDELLRAAADADFMERLARASGGQPHLLADLPQFLGELKGQPVQTAKKPRFIPDWRRNHSEGFLPGWVVVFALVLGLEWGLRRFWGLA